MKCFAITAEGTHCSREVVSGNTIALDGRVARLCNQHHSKFLKEGINMTNVWTTEPVYTAIINTSKEDTVTMNIDKDFDDKNSFDSAVAKLEGQPYTIYNGGYQGMFLLENCGHPECQQEYQEALWDNIGCICCGEDNCQHYYTLLCLNHTSKEDTMNINEIITNNTIKEENVPNSPVTGSSDRGDKWIKCVKCSKEIGSDWYHANVADVRTCMGAAPAPVKRVYKTDVLTGETVLTNSDLRFFYDSSKAVVFAKAKELREAGVHVFKVAKATKGNKDWYVEYKS